MTGVDENGNSFNFSLDEYIKRKNIDGQLCFVNLRKKDKYDNREKLDAGLNQIAKQIATGKKGCCGKFDRFSDDVSDNDDDDDNDYGKSNSLNDSDVEMAEVENPSIRFAKEIEKMDHPDCCKYKEFTTIEQKQGVRIKSQQWRVQKENCDRKDSLALDDERYKKVREGRVQKNYKNNNFNQAKVGTFVEKGNFTYKFADALDNEGDENEDNDSDHVIGIVRNKPITKIINRNRNFRQNFQANGFRGQQQHQQQPININVNLDGLYNVIKHGHGSSIVQPVATTSHQNDDLKFAARDILDYFLEKREKEREASLRELEERRKSCVNDGFSTINGNGIADLKITPTSTNMPMNLRFA